MTFILVQDTREQKGWAAPKGIDMVRATLLGTRHRTDCDAYDPRCSCGRGNRSGCHADWCGLHQKPASPEPAKCGRSRQSGPRHMRYSACELPKGHAPTDWCVGDASPEPSKACTCPSDRPHPDTYHETVCPMWKAKARE